MFQIFTARGDEFSLIFTKHFIGTSSDGLYNMQSIVFPSNLIIFSKYLFSPVMYFISNHEYVVSDER